MVPSGGGSFAVKPSRAADTPIPRVTLTVDEAARALGVSRDHLERHVLPQLRVVYSGRLRLVPVKELERWADEQATRWRPR
jgi:excisionase family DNA binding protein